MIVKTKTGLVVASGNVTSDSNYLYCNNFAFPNTEEYEVLDLKLPEGFEPWRCAINDGVFEEIPEQELETAEENTNDNQ